MRINERKRKYRQKTGHKSPGLDPVDRGHDQYAESGHPFAIHPRATEEAAKTSASAGVPIAQLMLDGAVMIEISIV